MMFCPLQYTSPWIIESEPTNRRKKNRRKNNREIDSSDKKQIDWSDKKQPLNSRCSCKSGKKYKKCCYKQQYQEHKLKNESELKDGQKTPQREIINLNDIYSVEDIIHNIKISRNNIDVVTQIFDGGRGNMFTTHFNSLYYENNILKYINNSLKWSLKLINVENICPITGNAFISKDQTLIEYKSLLKEYQTAHNTIAEYQDYYCSMDFLQTSKSISMKFNRLKEYISLL